jgi:hypothetical protein
MQEKKRLQQASSSRVKGIINSAVISEKVDSATATLPPVKRIEVQQLVTPMRFNRVSFQAASDGIREESLNYYLPTSILHAVKRIKEFGSYLMLKKNLNRGEFYSPSPPRALKTVDKITPQVYLVKTAKKEDIDYMYDEEGYTICPPFGETDMDKWSIVHYLYRTYSLDGFADMTVDGLTYKVRNEPIPQWDADLVIAIQGNHLIIGKL